MGIEARIFRGQYNKTNRMPSLIPIFLHSMPVAIKIRNEPHRFIDSNSHKAPSVGFKKSLVSFKVSILFLCDTQLKCLKTYTNISCIHGKSIPNHAYITYSEGKTGEIITLLCGVLCVKYNKSLDYINHIYHQSPAFVPKILSH